MADLYSTLRVSKTADQKTIKSSFRKLAKQYHPDHNPNNKEAQSKFAKISQAYEILSDASKRAQYDRGEIDEEGKPKFQGFDPRSGFNAGNTSYSQRNKTNFGGMNFDTSDIFRDFFGGGMGMGGNPFENTGRPVNKNINVEATISLEDIVKNDKINIKLNNGKKLKIQLPQYVEEGQIIRLRGQGEQQYPGKAGDMLLTLRIKKHPLFEVKNNDLYIDQAIDLQDAILGSKLCVQTLEGKISLTVPEWTSSGKLLRIKGKGLPMKKGGRGDLYIKLQIMLPEGYKKELKALFN